MTTLSLVFAALWAFACTPNPTDSPDRPHTEVAPQTASDTTRPATPYSFLSHPWKAESCLRNRFPAPDGATRTPQSPDSYGAWLRCLPLLPGRPDILLYDGTPKGNQEAHEAVFDLDLSPKDLQQCADAAMRLRAEFLFAAQRLDEIHFNATSGSLLDFKRWRAGYRPKLTGNTFVWSKTANPSNSHSTFRAYIDYVFNWAGTASLSKEMATVKPDEMRVGDLFIWGGHPGHAVTVVDMAQGAAGEKYFLLAQSYMPAQQLQLLRNPNEPDLSPWYRLTPESGGSLLTPEWTFAWADLKRWK